MKHLFALFLAFVLIFTTLIGNVYAVEFTELPTDQRERSLSFPSELKKAEGVLDKLTPAENADVVTIDDEAGFYSVQINGITMEITLPFGCICLTQDVFQQLNLYSSLFQNINEAYNYLVNRNIHMNIFDLITRQETLVFYETNSLSALIGNVNLLNDANMNNIMKYISTNWYANTPGKIVEFNGQTYFFFDLRESNGCVVYETFVGGADISVISYIEANDDVALAALNSMLEDFAVYENA